MTSLAPVPYMGNFLGRVAVLTTQSGARERALLATRHAGS